MHNATNNASHNAAFIASHGASFNEAHAIHKATKLLTKIPKVLSTLQQPMLHPVFLYYDSRDHSHAAHSIVSLLLKENVTKQVGELLGMRMP